VYRLLGGDERFSGTDPTAFAASYAIVGSTHFSPADAPQACQKNIAKYVSNFRKINRYYSHNEQNMESVVVFSGKNLDTIREDGGSGHWTARATRVENCEYVICVRNRREQWAATDLEHGTAFLIAKITKVLPSSYPGRIVISFENYAKLHVADAWRTLTGGQRFPIAYDQTSEIARKLRIDLNKLHWLPLNGLMCAEAEAVYSAKRNPFSEAIAGAKANLAESLGISPESIDIIIRT
jgi:hypothetical protein